MAANPINELTDNSMKNLRALVDSNTVIGDPVTTPDGTTILPVSKVSFGFGTGGSEVGGKSPRPIGENPFSGGGGAGVKVTPVCFLVVTGTNVKVLPTAPYPENSIDRILDMIPGAVEKIGDFFESRKEKDPEKEDKV